MECPINPNYFSISTDIYDCLNMESVRVLGSGLSGEVVLAVSRISRDYMIALKNIELIERGTYKKKKDLFIRELAVMQTVKHPYLMKDLYAVETPTDLYIGMEFCPRGCLLRHLGNLTYSKTERYLVQLAYAVRHMHNKKIAHCDIKLPNILVKSEESIILSDFGLSVFLPTNSDMVPLKHIGGTAAYVAPERQNLDTEQLVDPTKMDMYSLGVTLWGMTFRKNPEAEHYNYLEIVTNAKDIPEFLRLCLLGLLKADPRERYSSTELLQFVETWSNYREDTLICRTHPN